MQLELSPTLLLLQEVRIIHRLQMEREKQSKVAHPECGFAKIASSNWLASY